MLVALATAGCSHTSLAEVISPDTADDGDSTSLSKPSKLADPEIAVAKRDMHVNLCQMLTTPEVSAAMQRDPVAPAERNFGGCEWKFPTTQPDEHDSVRIGITGLDSEGSMQEPLQGNSVLQRRSSIGCEQTVALNHPDPHQKHKIVPELSVQVDAFDHGHEPADVCPTARGLLERAFDRLPPTNAPWGLH